MNAQGIKLLDMLAASQPEQENLAKEARLQAIINSKLYKKIKARQAFRQEFNQKFALDKLRTYSVTELDQVHEVLPVLSECLENILYSLTNGDCPKLTSADRPDFLNRTAVEELTQRLAQSNGKNYCNISADNFLAIFDDTTIKNPKSCFGKLPYSTDDYEKAIDEALSPQLYCISSRYLKTMQEEYETQIRTLERSIQAARTKRNFYRAFKLIIGLTAISLPAYFGSLYGNLTSDVTTGCTVLVTVGALVYWIKG